MTLKEIFFADFLWIFKGLQGIAKFLSRGHGQSVFNGGRGQPVFNGRAQAARFDRRAQRTRRTRKSKGGQSYMEVIYGRAQPVSLELTQCS